VQDEFERVITLRREIEDANKQYYGLDQPRITDAEYDALMRELLNLEASHPNWVTPDSPTLRVGGEVAKEYTKVRHLESLLSLDNAFAAGDLREFDRRVRQAAPVVDYVVELKIDGLTVALTYEEGLMVRGATRGDGSLWGILNLYKSIVNKLSRITIPCYLELDTVRCN